MTVPTPRRVMFGASITRTAAPQLRAKIPYIVVDGTDDNAHGGTSYQTDGRGLITKPSRAQGDDAPEPWGLSMGDAYLDEIARGTTLRAGAPNRDWVVMELGLGTEDRAVDEPVIDNIVSSVID